MANLWYKVAPASTWSSSCPQMSYMEAVKFVFSAAKFPDNSSKHDDPSTSFERVKYVLREMGNPDHQLKIVHVTGTNGKGSCSALAEIALRENFNVKTGLFTSPHMHTMRERIRVNGELISQEDFVKQVMKCYRCLASDPLLAVFDKLTLVALSHFADAGVEWAVLEVGMGGRFDATNATTANVSGIAHISMDHMSVLGDTVEKIAGEKAGIMKPNVPVFSVSNQNPGAMKVLMETASRVGAPFTACLVSDDDRKR
eukprot:c5534_g1_i1.p1 GENE.c5534_g1_i1~~c5534_g1_i1.p1  ORF type:complete len:288 (-),score=47.62 c5534_g1_i1:393-1160(-)